MDFPYELETVLSEVLRVNSRGEYYGIDADSFGSTKGAWEGAWATLTAYQFNNPEKREEIFKFLEEYYDFSEANKLVNNYEDQKRLKSFIEDLRTVINK
ncbi:hypothetical protein GUM07_03945 [Listeria monocytogenes]|nr:hypothetical protein [Listeria monocytogenes]